MTNNTQLVSVPRELLERVFSSEIGMTARKDQWAAAHELRALLAAPAEDVRAVVEEPVAYTNCHDPEDSRPKRTFILPERHEPDEGSWDRHANGFNDCLDEVEELNK